VFEAALEGLCKARRLERLGPDTIRKVGRAVSLSPEQERLRGLILERFEAARFRPPLAKELAEALELGRGGIKQIEQLFKLLAAEEVLVHLGQGMYLLREVVTEAREALLAPFRRGEVFSASQFRDALSTTRKYAIPILEYFDQTGITVRRGSDRVLKRSLEEIDGELSSA
jgi:selenocysteine-specific elongation factor